MEMIGFYDAEIARSVPSIAVCSWKQMPFLKVASLARERDEEEKGVYKRLLISVILLNAIKAISNTVTAIKCGCFKGNEKQDKLEGIKPFENIWS